MPNSVENIYSSAFLEVLEEKHGNDKAGYALIMSELSGINDALTASPELISFSLIPTVSRGDKIGVVKNIFSGKVSAEVLNFLCVLTEKNRLSRFGGIYRGFRSLYYEKFGITPVTVSSAFALTAEQKSKITAKMEKITGGQIELSEKTDKNLIGGVVVDYSGSRIDGSVKTRLETLKKEIAETVI
ncbi:MAG: ATP synthase F1 subunit delta [Oscillospiraceae bacterium]|nr:ATP synthase F1 subunit delta [Oscillospiraceae bacterium]